MAGHSHRHGHHVSPATVTRIAGTEEGSLGTVHCTSLHYTVHNALHCTALYSALKCTHQFYVLHDVNTTVAECKLHSEYTTDVHYILCTPDLNNYANIPVKVTLHLLHWAPVVYVMSVYCVMCMYSYLLKVNSFAQAYLLSEIFAQRNWLKRQKKKQVKPKRILSLIKSVFCYSLRIQKYKF